MIKTLLFNTRSPLLKFRRLYQRERVEKQQHREISKIVYLQVIGNGSPGSGPSVYLFTKHKRYLFNCGEGTQRLVNEYRTNLSKIEHIFLTRNTWDRFGGTPGMCLTLQDFECSNITIHGPPGIDKMFGAARKFLKLNNIQVEMSDCMKQMSFEDPLMSVRYVPLRSNENKENLSMAFVCKLHEQPGDFCLEKCVEKGIDSTEMVMSLKKGNDITLPDGSIVTAKEVSRPSDPSVVFTFIDIPDETFLESLQDLNSHGNSEDLAKIVIHFTPENIVKNPIYQKWLKAFPSTTTHWILNERNKFSGQSAPNILQAQLNAIDNKVFPLLNEVLPNKQQDPKEELRILNVFHIRPPNGFEQSLPQQSLPENAIEEMTPELKKLISKYKREVTPRSDNERAKEFPRIITLGTGSGMPTKTRNDSCNLIHITNDSCALLDCGESAFGQLIRFYGREKTDELLKNLRFIFISHLHADHHLGLFQILNQRRKVTNEKVVLFAPITISNWLVYYNHAIEEISSTFDFVPCTGLLAYHIEEDMKKSLCNRLGLTDIETCYVNHCNNAFGISLEMKNSMQNERFPNDNLKITYSGDAAPTSELINIGRNSDVLIHEATMEDDLESLAKVKKHSTISQAVEAGRKMNAKFVILTHFSNRYGKIPLVEKEFPNVAIAFDNMEVTLNDLPSVDLLHEPLKAMFSRQIELLERRVVHRRNREERETWKKLRNVRDA